MGALTVTVRMRGLARTKGRRFFSRGVQGTVTGTPLGAKAKGGRIESERRIVIERGEGGCCLFPRLQEGRGGGGVENEGEQG